MELDYWLGRTEDPAVRAAEPRPLFHRAALRSDAVRGIEGIQGQRRRAPVVPSGQGATQSRSNRVDGKLTLVRKQNMERMNRSAARLAFPVRRAALCLLV